MAQPLIIYPDSSSTDYKLSVDRDDLFRTALIGYRHHIATHRNMLSSATSDALNAEPLLFVKTRPQARHSAGTSLGRSSEAIRQRYHQLAADLRRLETAEGAAPLVDAGAIRTAAGVIEHLSKNQVAPPELSWIAGEAVLMLWALGDTKYALTVTDGELGYVVRAKGTTLRRDHSIPVDDIDILRITE